MDGCTECQILIIEAFDLYTHQGQGGVLRSKAGSKLVTEQGLLGMIEVDQAVGSHVQLHTWYLLISAVALPKASIFIMLYLLTEFRLVLTMVDIPLSYQFRYLKIASRAALNNLGGSLFRYFYFLFFSIIK